MSITSIHHLAAWLLLAVIAVGCTRNGTSSQQNGANSTDATVPAPPASGPVAEDRSWQAPEGFEVAVLAGGCFWGMEEILRAIPGVKDTEVGYTGGALPNPTYDDLHDGKSGHAESVRVFFDPKVLSYADLLEKWFFRMHDPTTKNRQGNDVGSQYRSAIFVTSEEQRRVALQVIDRVGKSGNWKEPIVTEVVNAGKFTRAEGYHQDYLQRTPNGYTCHYLRDFETI